MTTRKPPKKASTGVSFAQLAARRPREMKLVLPPDGDGADHLRKAVETARENATMARLRSGFLVDDPAEAAAAAKLEEAVATAEAELEAASTVLVIRALPGPELEDLRMAHPPTAEQLAAAEADPGKAMRVDPATFEPALIAASLVVAPPLSVEQVTQLKAAWSEADWEQLRMAALQVNGESKIQLLGN